MHTQEYAGDPLGPVFDPQLMLGLTQPGGSRANPNHPCTGGFSARHASSFSAIFSSLDTTLI